MKGRQSSKQEISAYRVKGFLKINRDQPPFYLISFCVVQNILDRPYGITKIKNLHVPAARQYLLSGGTKRPSHFQSFGVLCYSNFSACREGNLLKLLGVICL